MSLLSSIVRELVAYRRIVVGGEEAPQRGVVEYGDGVQYADDPDRDRTRLHFAFAPAGAVSASGAASQSIPVAPTVHFVEGSASEVSIALPPAQLCHGKSVRIVDVGSMVRTITIVPATGELDEIDGGLDPLVLIGAGVSIDLVAYPGDIERRMGWYSVSVKHRG